MNEVKGFFQLVDVRDGTRSPAMGASRKEFARTLLSWVCSNPDNVPYLYVLVLVDDIKSTDSQSWDFSTAPLLTVKSFIEQFSGE